MKHAYYIYSKKQTIVNSTLSDNWVRLPGWVTGSDYRVWFPGQVTRSSYGVRLPETHIIFRLLLLFSRNIVFHVVVVRMRRCQSNLVNGALCEIPCLVIIYI